MSWMKTEIKFWHECKLFILVKLLVILKYIFAIPGVCASEKQRRAVVIYLLYFYMQTKSVYSSHTRTWNVYDKAELV